MFECKANDMHTGFLQRGYDKNVIEQTRTRAMEMLNLKTYSLKLIETRTKCPPPPPRMCFSTKYSPCASHVKSIVLKQWPILTFDLSESIYSQPFSYPGSMGLCSQAPHGNYKCVHCARCDNTTNTNGFLLPPEYKSRKQNPKLY